jgi:hypothetical protein
MRAVLCSGFAMIAVILSSTWSAYADGGVGVTVVCGSRPTPGCIVGAHTAPQAGAASTNVSKDGPRATCALSSGKRVPCYDPTFGWLGSNGCYYKLDTTFHPPAWDTADQPPAGVAGAYYLETCAVGVNIAGTGGGIVWLPAGAAPGPVTPIALARQATNALALPTPRIDISPYGQQLVNLPTWLWISGPTYVARSATAAVPGESVTATATPTSVVWSMGNGAEVTCHGAGTAYTPSARPTDPSPDCGYTYHESSSTQPRSAFVVSATVHWSVAWVGGGQTGTLPGLTTTATLHVPVAESQALNTN